MLTHLQIQVSKALKKQIKSVASSQGESLREFVTRAIQKEIERTQKTKK